MLSIEGIGYEDCLTTFFRLPTSKDAVMPSANFAVLFVQKRAAFPCTFLCFCLPFLSAPKYYTKHRKSQQKNFCLFATLQSKKTRSFLVQSVRGMVFAGGLPPDHTQSKDSRKYYCESYQAFWEYAHPRLLQVQKIFRQRNLFRPGRG